MKARGGSEMEGENGRLHRMVTEKILGCKHYLGHEGVGTMMGVAAVC